MGIEEENLVPRMTRPSFNAIIRFSCASCQHKPSPVAFILLTAHGWPLAPSQAPGRPAHPDTPQEKQVSGGVASSSAHHYSQIPQSSAKGRFPKFQKVYKMFYFVF